MRALTAIGLLAVLFVPSIIAAQVQTYTATHTYILGDQDSKADARERCLLEAKRKILEQAGVYVETQFEMKESESPSGASVSVARQTNALSAAILQLKDTKEEIGFQQGHLTLTLTVTADVDLAEVKKQLDKRHVDTGVRDEVAAQQERLKRLEAQLDAMQQQQQVGQASGRAPAPPQSDISIADLQALRARAANGDAGAQIELGLRYYLGNGVPQDYVKARQWYEQAAAQGNANAQVNLGVLHFFGRGVPQDYAQAQHWYEKVTTQDNARAQNGLGMLYNFGHGVPQDYDQARQWYEKAAAQGDAGGQFNIGALYANGEGVPQDYVRAYMWLNLAAARSTGDGQKLAAAIRDRIARGMTPAQAAEAQRLAREWKPRKETKQ